MSGQPQSGAQLAVTVPTVVRVPTVEDLAATLPDAPPEPADLVGVRRCVGRLKSQASRDGRDTLAWLYLYAEVEIDNAIRARLRVSENTGPAARENALTLCGIYLCAAHEYLKQAARMRADHTHSA